MPAELLIPTNHLKKAALLYRAINHKIRTQILLMLHQKGRVSVTPIYKKLKLEQAVCSQHLAILRRAAIVKTEREGKQIFYSVNYQQIALLHESAAMLLPKDKS